MRTPPTTPASTTPLPRRAFLKGVLAAGSASIIATERLLAADALPSTSGRGAGGEGLPQANTAPHAYTLPAPKLDGRISVEKTLKTRRSLRKFQNKELTQEQLSQLLWSAYGITAPPRFRTSPSAGGTYPLEIYAAVGNVKGIQPGLYKYIPREHKITQTINTDIRPELTQASLNQRMITAAPVTLIWTAVFERTTARYGDRGIKYVHMEIGHSSQNVYLQATALNLGTCAIGAFTDKKITDLLQLPPKEAPLYLMPVGFVE